MKNERLNLQGKVGSGAAMSYVIATPTNLNEVTKFPSGDLSMAESNSVFRKMSSDAVKARTGKDWKAWLTILDKFDLTKKGHTASAKFLREKHGLSNWWSQAVVIHYEWERGLRK